MADIVQQKAIAEIIDERALISYLSWTAGGASDSATWTGQTIDREAFSTGAMPRGFDGVIFYDATLASGKTLAVSWDLQTSPDNSTWTDYATEASTVIATGPSGGGRVVGVARLVVPDSNKVTGTPGVSLGAAQRYVRLNVLPHLSATGTDTGIIAAVGVFGGWEQLAAPAT